MIEKWKIDPKFNWKTNINKGGSLTNETRYFALQHGADITDMQMLGYANKGTITLIINAKDSSVIDMLDEHLKDFKLLTNNKNCRYFDKSFRVSLHYSEIYFLDLLFGGVAEIAPIPDNIKEDIWSNLQGLDRSCYASINLQGVGLLFTKFSDSVNCFSKSRDEKVEPDLTGNGNKFTM